MMCLRHAATLARQLVPNPHSVHLGMKEDLDSCWCDILHHLDHEVEEEHSKK